ncbi:4'-phosphopantetheinyl transferase family protein [Streptomyces sp. NBC_01089]|uniref:4'-phosphopantetheinyl transferase family protein n=1 Tax=Streptomyces sp. NBC_01089 TaxID=2903747 RepID=UPI0038693928|nr:4'-phosphopantetheinyl transferase superfamily protein [Streptomyces sp. NBC_01089]
MIRPSPVHRRATACAGRARQDRDDILIVVAERGHGPRPDRHLTPQDHAEAHRLPVLRATEFLEGRTLLRWVLGQAVGLDENVTVVRRPGGKPELAEAPWLGISVSHTRKLFAVALARGRAVGLDVEPPVCPGPGLIRRCCGPDDRGRMDTLSPSQRARAFGVIWTVQESCLKATGDGVRGRPGRVPVTVGQRQGRWAGYVWRSLPRLVGEAAAVAVSAAPSPPRRIRIVPLPGGVRAERAFSFGPLRPVRRHDMGGHEPMNQHGGCDD